MTEPLLRIDDLRVDIATRDRTVHALDGISLDLAAGEALGVVGLLPVPEEAAAQPV